MSTKQELPRDSNARIEIRKVKILSTHQCCKATSGGRGWELEMMLATNQKFMCSGSLALTSRTNVNKKVPKLLPHQLDTESTDSVITNDALLNKMPNESSPHVFVLTFAHNRACASGMSQNNNARQTKPAAT